MSEEPVTLLQIVAALSITYTDDGVLTWLTSQNRHLRTARGMGFPDGRACSPYEFIFAGRIEDVADAVARIGDCDPREFAPVAAVPGEGR